LFQLPPSLQFDARRTTAFFTLLRELHNDDVVLEPRQKSWFRRDAEDLLTGFRVARVATDPGMIPEAKDPGGWNGVV